MRSISREGRFPVAEDLAGILRDRRVGGEELGVEAVSQVDEALGTDGDKVRGALERDFAAYAQKSAKANASQRRAVLLSMATPFAARAAKTAADALFRPDAGTMAERMAEIRDRAEQEVAKARDASAKAKAADDDSASAGA